MPRASTANLDSADGSKDSLSSSVKCGSSCLLPYAIDASGNVRCILTFYLQRWTHAGKVLMKYHLLHETKSTSSHKHAFKNDLVSHIGNNRTCDFNGSGACRVS